MIDEEWLRTLRFESFKGLQITGLAGVGSEHVVFEALAPDGKKLVMKTYRHFLAFHIKELPPHMTARKEYDLGRVNDKLRRLVGRDDLDEMTSEYDRLYSGMISAANKNSIKGIVLASMMSGLLDDEMTFLLKSPGMKRRLTHWATMREEAKDLMDLIVIVNGPNFPITIPRVELIEWAREALAEIDALPEPADLQPELLPSNPLYVWGAAAMDGFFTDDELPAVADYIEEHFGRLPGRDDVLVLLNQCSALADLMTSYLKESEARRFQKLAAACGMYFQLRPKRQAQDVVDALRSTHAPSTSLWQRIRRWWSAH